MHNIPFGNLKKSSYNARDRAQIDGWQDRANALAEQENFRLHPVTRRLAEEAHGQIEIIDNRLKTEEDMDPLERKALFKVKKAHEFYLSLFTIDGSAELKEIEQKVNDELQPTN